MNLYLTTPLAAVVLVILLLPGASRASVLYTNLGTGSSYNISSGNSVGNQFTGNNFAEGDLFTPTSTAKFGSLEIALSSNFVSPDSYTVALRNDKADSPGTVIESFTAPGVALGNFGTNNPLILFNSILQPTLTSGTRYWITVATDLNDSILWNVNTTDDVSDEANSTDGGVNWFSPSGLTPGAFQVNSAAVPEPAAIWPLAGPLSLLLLRRNRDRRRPDSSR